MEKKKEKEEVKVKEAVVHDTRLPSEKKDQDGKKKTGLKKKKRVKTDYVEFRLE